MPEALVRSLEKEVGMFLILVQTFRFLSSALRLTTFMTTIRDCPLKSPKVRNQGDAPGADAQVKGGAVAGQHGEVGDGRLDDSIVEHRREGLVVRRRHRLVEIVLGHGVQPARKGSERVSN